MIFIQSSIHNPNSPDGENRSPFVKQRIEHHSGRQQRFGVKRSSTLSTDLKTVVVCCHGYFPIRTTKMGSKMFLIMLMK